MAIFIQEYNGTNNVLQATSLYRDTSSHYYIKLEVDTTHATSTERIRLYVNGVRISLSIYAGGYPTLNHDTAVSNTVLHTIGKFSTSATYGDFYLAETLFLDGIVGQDFGEFDSTYGHWKPKKYEGTYGTNGFYQTYSNGANIGEDSSGNGNDFTATNLATTDIVLDSPTNNFCVLNAIDPLTTGTLSEGNLKTTGNAKVTIRPTSGKWYYEYYNAGTITGVSYDADVSGEFNPTLTTDTYNFGQDSSFAGQTTAGGNTDQNGQGDFKLAVPSGYLALCTANLDTIPQPYETYVSCTTENDYFEGTYVGNGNINGTFIYLGFLATDICIDGTHYDQTSSLFDFTANGIKCRSTTKNSNGVTYTIEAWVDVDFKYGNAN